MLLCLIVGAKCAEAQRASLAGEVRDPSGLGIPQVKLTVVNVDQGLTREAWSDHRGEFSFLLLQPGRYEVEAQKDGFAAAEVTGIDLHVGDHRSLRIVLPVAGVRISIQVTDHNSELDTSPGLSYVVSGDTIRQAPLITRDVLDLSLLQPGVLPVNPDASSGVSFTIAGNRNDSIGFLLDGAHNNDLLDNSITFDPNPDTISEFKILTTGYTAEYGRNAGGEITLLTKAGTRSLHGTAFDYVRNDALNATSYFNGVAGVPRDTLKRNQLGATLGGPLALPGRKETREQGLFFFLAYQGTIQSSTQTVTTPAFTPVELTGDFSHSGAGGSPDQGVACFLSGKLPDGTPCGRPAHPQYQSDLNQGQRAIIGNINPVANAYIQSQLIPAGANNQITAQQGGDSHAHEFTAKLDWEASPRQKASITLGGDRGSVLSPFSFGDGSVPGFPTHSRGGDNFLNLTYLLIIHPNLLNEFRVGLQRAFNDALLPANSEPLANALGIQIAQDDYTGPPILAFDSGLTIGYSPLGPQHIANNTFSYSDTLTWVHGVHSLKFGAGIAAYQSNIDKFDFFVNGAFFFSGSSRYTGNSEADFLLGLPLVFQQGPAALSNVRSKASYVFANDEVHVRPNLVVTAGLRYEYSTPKTDTMNRIFSILPGHQSVIFPNAPVGMVFPGDPGAPRGANFPDRTNFAPRFGFAWNPNQSRNWTVRAGAGVFFDILKAEDNFQFNGQEPFYSSSGVRFPSFSQPYAPGTDPFPSQPPTSSTNFSSLLPINSSSSVFVVDPHLHAPPIYQYSLSVQRRIPWDTVAEAAYVGSSSHGLTALVDVNPFQLGTSNRVLNLTSPNANCGVSNTSGKLCFATLPEFRNISNASFNSLQASLRKQPHTSARFGRTYFTLAFTYSHNIDNASGFRNRNSQVPYYHPDYFHASSDFDLRHHVVFSGGWDLPFDSWASKAPRALTSGWSVFPIVSWRSGFPLDVLANLSTDPRNPGPSGAGDPGLARADLIAPIRLQDPHAAGHFWFDPASFSATSTGPYGSLRRNAFRGPGRYNINLALAKSLPLGREDRKVEIRADFFNLLNHTEFSNPVTNLSDTVHFGQITSTAAPRIIQLSGRFIF